MTQNGIRIISDKKDIILIVHEDVDLFDVLEMISDCVAAGLVRSGSVRKVEIDKDVLYKAFENTCSLIEDMCELVD